jgi:hypothetical protein
LDVVRRESLTFLFTEVADLTAWPPAEPRAPLAVSCPSAAFLRDVVPDLRLAFTAAVALGAALPEAERREPVLFFVRFVTPVIQAARAKKEC